MDRELRVKACLNGARRPDEHPALPVTPAQLADAAAAAVAAGAGALHLHPRGDDGTESLAAKDVGAAIDAVRAACPGVPLGVTTGLWVSQGDAARRYADVERWTVLPDFASVNVSEPGFADLAALLDERGVGVEAGVWTSGDAWVLARIRRTGWFRVLVEVDTEPAEDVLRALAEYGIEGPKLLHGEGDGAWPMVARAGQLGLPTRIGLEDTLLGPLGQPVADNAELVRLALELWEASR